MKEFEKKEYEIKPLLQYENFTDEWFQDETYSNTTYMPYIFMKIGEGNTVESVSIKMVDSRDDSHDKVKFKPLDLFLIDFWKLIDISRDPEYSICFETKIFLGGVKYDEKGWREYSIKRDGHLPSYEIPYPVDCFNNIWNEYCLYTGLTTISRYEFCLWIFRLCCVAYDVLIKPIINEEDWQKRFGMISEVLGMMFSDKYEYLAYGAWDSIRDGEYIEKEEAFYYRLQDAKLLLAEFYNSVDFKTSLEMFLKEFYDDFGALLCEKEYLLKCGLCGRYIDYYKGKLYCSLKGEGRDCGTRARNRRYYDNHKDELRKRNKKSMNSLRKFYKEKGVKK